MSNLDVALRLRLLYQPGGASQATRDLQKLKREASGLNRTGGPDKLKRDILEVSSASRSADRSLSQVRREATALGGVRGPERLKRDILDVSSAARQAERSIRGAADAVKRMRTSRPAGDTPGGRKPKAADLKDTTATPALIAGSPRLLARLGGAYLGYRTVTGAVREAVSFEAAMAEVKKKVNDATPEQMEGVEKLIRRMSLQTGIARAEMAGLVAEAGAAGVAVQDLETFMTTTAKAAVAWDMAPREASEKLAYIRAAAQMSYKELAALADKINALGDNSAAKERDIVEMFLRSGAAAKTAGVQFDDTLAIITGVRSTGMQEETVSRWFNAFTSKLANAKAGKKKGKDSGWALLGLNADEVRKGMTKDALGTILKVFDAINAAPQLKKVSALTKIFGEGWQDETARAAQALPEIRKQVEYLKTSTNWSGSLDKAWVIQLATTKNHFERLKVLAGEIGDRLSRWALPGINSAIEGALKKFDELEERVGWWERKRAEAEARGDADKVVKGLQEQQKKRDWWGDNVGKPMRRLFTGDERPLDEQLGEWYFGRKVTRDPARQYAQAALQSARDAEDKAKRLREEADKQQNKKKKAELIAQAVEQDRIAENQRRVAGTWAARDMTGVEAGEDLARAAIAGQRQKREAEEAEIRRLLAERSRLQGVLAWPGQYPERGGFENRFKELTENLRKRLTGDDLSPAARALIERYTESLATEGEKATAKAREIAEQLRQILNITLTPTIRPSFQNPFPGAPGSEAPQPQSFPGAPARGPLQRDASVGRTMTVHTINVHGVRDLAALERELTRLQDTDIAFERDSALHDIGSYA